MKVALLRQKPFAVGGAATTLTHLARGLAAAGHEVTVYGAGKPAGPVNHLGPGVRYLSVPVWGGKTGRLLSYALNTRRRLQNDAGQLIFSLERTLCQQVYRAGDGCHREWLARRAPHLSLPARLVQEISPFHRVMLSLEKRLFASSPLVRVIANSRQVMGEIQRHYHVPSNKIRVIYNGLDHDQFRPLAPAARQALAKRLGAPAGGRLILFVGSGFARKGLAFLLPALAHLPDKKAHLWVVGKGQVGPYQRLARSWGVSDRLRFLGPQTEVAPFYQAAAVLALPTLYDPCSNVVLEALASGCPVLTTCADGAAEFVNPVYGRIISAPGQTTELTQALEDLLAIGDDPQVRQAAAAAVAHLHWDQTVSQTLAVLEEAASLAGSR